MVSLYALIVGKEIQLPREFELKERQLNYVFIEE